MARSFLIYKNGADPVIEDAVKTMPNLVHYKIIDCGGAIGWGPHEVTHFPTMIVLDDGEERCRAQGFPTVEAMVAWMKSFNLFVEEETSGG